MENLPKWSYRLPRISLIAATCLTLFGWLVLTPPGLLGKADAAGYAVCHRIAVRSFHIGDRQTPLCARCTGMFLGALLGILYQARSGKRAGMPSVKISVLLALFFLAFAVDGGNSYLHFFPNAPSLYQPENWLRLVTGTGVGLGIAAVLFPVFNQVAWQNLENRPALGRWRDFLPLLGLAAFVDLAVLSENPLLLYPLALLSALAIFVILSMVYAVVWLMISKKENRAVRLQDLHIPAIAGFFIALLQIILLDAFRFLLTGTWAGFNL
jgi:uncharacterized membrane protein